MSDQTWLTVVVSAVTSGVVSISAQRISKALDRHAEEKEKKDSQAPLFVIERIEWKGSLELQASRFGPHRILNVGTADATNVTATIMDRNDSWGIRNLPNNSTIRMGGRHEFHIFSSNGSLQGLRITCDQLSDGVDVYIPD